MTELHVEEAPTVRLRIQACGGLISVRFVYSQLADADECDLSTGRHGCVH